MCAEFQLQVGSVDDLRDGRVLAALQLRFESTGGVALTQPIVNVYTLAHGKLKRVEVFRDRIDALKAVVEE
jgi:hypothetical protein